MVKSTVIFFLLQFYWFFSVANGGTFACRKKLHTHTNAPSGHYALTQTRAHAHARNCNCKLFLHIFVVVFCVNLAADCTHTYTHAYIHPSAKLVKSFFSPNFFSGCKFLYPSSTHTHIQTQAGQTGWRQKKNVFKPLKTLFFWRFSWSTITALFAAHFQHNLAPNLR